jgi:hypothetical protein
MYEPAPPRETLYQQVWRKSNKTIFLHGSVPNKYGEHLFRCALDHAWRANISDVLSGIGCPRCSENKLPVAEEDEHSLSEGPVSTEPFQKTRSSREPLETLHQWVQRESNGTVEIYGEYADLAGKHLLRCNLGHAWRADLSGNFLDVICPGCNDKEEPEVEDVQKAQIRKPAQVQKVRLPSTDLDTSTAVDTATLRLQRRLREVHGEAVRLEGKYQDQNAQTKFSCGRGHYWFARATDILGGQGCLSCGQKAPKKKPTKAGIGQMSEPRKIIKKTTGTKRKKIVPLVSRADVARCFDISPFRQTVERFALSTRLRNTLERNADQIDQNFPTIGSIIEKNSAWAEWFAERANVGDKTVKEVNQILVRILITAISKCEEADQSEYSKLSIEKFARALVHEQWKSFNSPPLTKGLEALSQSIEKLDTQLFSEDHDKELERNFEVVETDPKTALETYLSKFLPDRELDILKRRYGLTCGRKQTLQQISEGYHVTRERVRQLESKALRSCSSENHRTFFFDRFIEALNEDILLSVMSSCKLVLDVACKKIEDDLPGHIRLAIHVRYNGLAGYLDSNLDRIYDHGDQIGWCDPRLTELERIEIREVINSGDAYVSNILANVKSALGRSPWPISLQWLVENLFIFSEDQIVSVIEIELGGCVQDDQVLRLEHLPAKTRLMLTLRSFGRSAHLSEIKSKHNSVFGVETTEHAAGAVLSRLGEALIVERGRYCLYEHLDLSEAEIVEIADFCHSELADREVYTSAKILARDLGAKSSILAPRINPYIVLGICQDDGRFDSKRGMMLGLARGGFHEEFTSLTVSLRQVVVENGPITVSEIKSALSDTRELLDVTIGMLLDTVGDVVRVASATYDYVPRVFGSDTEKESFVRGLALCVVDGPSSLPVISSRIGALNFNFDNITILSLAQKIDQFEIENSMISLVSQAPELEEYNRIFHENFDTHSPPKQNLETFQNLELDSDTKKFVELDFRLRMPIRNWQAATRSAQETETIIDEIFSEYDF